MRVFTLSALTAFSLLVAGCSQKMDAATDNVTEQVGAADPNAPTIFCPEVQRRLPVEECDDLTRLAAAAREGTAAFNVPSMERGKTETLQLAISLKPPTPAPAPPVDDDDRGSDPSGRDGAPTNNTTDNLANASGEAASPSVRPDAAPPLKSDDPAAVVEDLAGETQTFTPMVGRFMRAKLAGEGFTIEPGEFVSQEVLPGSVTVWTWAVTPQKAARHTLTLTTVVEGKTSDGKPLPLRSTTHNETVIVTEQWYHKLWDWLTGLPDWAKLIAGALGAVTSIIVAWKALKSALSGKKADTPSVEPATKQGSDKPQ